MRGRGRKEERRCGVHPYCAAWLPCAAPACVLAHGTPWCAEATQALRKAAHVVDDLVVIPWSPLLITITGEWMMDPQHEERLNTLWPLVIGTSASCFTLRDLKCVSVVCRDFFDSIKHHIGNNYPFRIPNETVAKWFTPKRVVHICLRVSYISVNACHAPHPFPPQLTELLCYTTFGALPHTLTRLSLGSYFNQPVDNLPPNLKELNLCGIFNHPVNLLPPGLTHLTFGPAFNHPVNLLPSSLIQLHLGSNFNQCLDHLPSSLTYLTFDDYDTEFNHSLDHLPSSLTNLSIPTSFNQTINKLPHSLTSLYIRIASNIAIHPNTNLRFPTWPPALKELGLHKFTLEGYGNLPTTIEHLILWGDKNSRNDGPIISYIPPSVTRLEIQEFPHNITNWNALPLLQSLSVHEVHKGTIYPPTLTELNNRDPDAFHGNPFPASITHLFFQVHTDVPPPLPQHLPPNLTHLTINGYGDDFDMSVDHLPATITHLVLHSFDFNKPVDHLPSSLRHLTIDSGVFDQPVDHLPSPLLELHLNIISEHITHPVNHLPPSLTSLSLPDHFNHPLDHLPSSLISLRLGKYFSLPLLHLPSSLTSLHLSKYLSLPLLLPSSLSILKLNFKYLEEKGVSFDSLPPFVSIINAE